MTFLATFLYLMIRVLALLHTSLLLLSEILLLITIKPTLLTCFLACEPAADAALPLLLVFHL